MRPRRYTLPLAGRRYATGSLSSICPPGYSSSATASYSRTHREEEAANVTSDEIRRI